MNKISEKSIITIFLYLCTIIPLINSQQSESQPSQAQTKLQESIEKFEKIDLLYKNITEKMGDVKYNILLIIKYRILVSKHKHIMEKIDEIKASINAKNKSEEILLNNIYNLNEYIYSFNRNCHKTLKLYYYFDSLKNTILNLIKIFFLTLGILILLTLIISGIILFYYYKKRRNYSILQEEINQTNSELTPMKDGYSKKEKFDKGKKHKKKSKIVNKKVRKKNENIEVLDDK